MMDLCKGWCNDGCIYVKVDRLMGLFKGWYIDWIIQGFMQWLNYTKVDVMNDHTRVDAMIELYKSWCNDGFM